MAVVPARRVVAGLQGYSFASFAKLGARYPSAGGLLDYAAKSTGDCHFTGISAWLAYSANAIVTAMVAVSFGSYATSTFAGENQAWIKFFAALIIIIMTGVNIVGSKLVANAQTVIVYVVLGILASGAISIITLAGILVLSVALDFGSKHLHDTRATNVQLAQVTAARRVGLEHPARDLRELR